MFYFLKHLLKINGQNQKFVRKLHFYKQIILKKYLAFFVLNILLIFQYFQRSLSDQGPFAENDRRDRQLWRAAFIGDRLRSASRSGALRCAPVRQDEALFRAAYRRLRIDRGTDPRDVPADAAHGGRARLHRERSGERGRY